MDIYVLVYLLLIALICFVSIMFFKGSLILMMLLPASEFLGFVDPMRIAVKGMFDIHALIVLIIFITIIVSLQKIQILASSNFIIPFIVFIFIWLFGVIYPYISGNSSIYYSLKASKEFMTIFSFFSIVLFFKTQKDIDFGWKCLIFFGIYYSILEITGQFVGPFLKSMMSYHMRREDVFFWKIYAPFWPVIIVALYYFYFEFALQKSKPVFKLGITAFGLLLTFFRSYLLATMVALPLVIIFTGVGFSLALLRTTLLGVFCGTCLIMLVFISFVMGSEALSVGSITDKFLVSAIKEVTTQSGGSLQGREKVTERRRELLSKSPYIGYGFIEKESKFGKQAKRIVDGDNLGFIDMGLLDVPIKFGYIGFAVLMINIIYIFRSLIRMSKASENIIFKVRCLTIAAVLITFILVLPVHAPFTYSYGLLPLGISLGLIEKEWMILSDERQEAL